MKKITAIIFGLLFTASLTHAGAITKDSSWDDILSDPTLKAVFPAISVGNGKFVSYNNLFLDRDKLTTGGTWEDPVQVQHRTSSDDKDRAPAVIRTVTRKTEAPLNYTGRDCTVANVVQGHDSDYVEPMVCNPVTGQHAQTVNVHVFRKVTDRLPHDTKDRSGDIYLFTKKYSVPVYDVN
jgi:hypothetical protein